MDASVQPVERVVHGLLHTCCDGSQYDLSYAWNGGSAGRWRRMTRCHAVTLQARLACSGVRCYCCGSHKGCFDAVVLAAVLLLHRRAARVLHGTSCSWLQRWRVVARGQACRCAALRYPCDVPADSDLNGLPPQVGEHEAPFAQTIGCGCHWDPECWGGGVNSAGNWRWVAAAVFVFGFGFGCATRWRRSAL
jgi:hypothetical protein